MTPFGLAVKAIPYNIGPKADIKYPPAWAIPDKLAVSTGDDVLAANIVMVYKKKNDVAKPIKIVKKNQYTTEDVS